MSTVTTIHGQMSVVDASGNVQVLHQETSGSDVKIDIDNNIVSNVDTIQKLVDKMGKIAFKSKLDNTDFSSDMIVNNTTTSEGGKILDARVAKELSNRISDLEDDYTIVYSEINELDEVMPTTEVNDKIISTSLTWSSKKLSDNLIQLNTLLSNSNELLGGMITDERTNRTNSVNNIENTVNDLKSTMSNLQQSTYTGSDGTVLKGYSDEVVGLRQGYYGDNTVYPSAGDAVKAQIQKIRQGLPQMTISGDDGVLRLSKVTQLPGDVGVDSSLTIAGYAAEARSTGRKLDKCGGSMLATMNNGSVKLDLLNIQKDVVDSVEFVIPEMNNIVTDYDDETNTLHLDLEKSVLNIDSSLTYTGKAADAGATGKAIRDLDKNVNEHIDRYADLIDGGHVILSDKTNIAEPSIYALPASEKNPNVYGTLANKIQQLSTNKQKVLWSGMYYMNASQTITLSEKISDQQNGIVLCFSEYDSTNKSLTGGRIVFFVPKIEVEIFEGKAHTFSWQFPRTTNPNGSKYIYIYNNKLIGNDNNLNYGTNNKFVLAYVFGV